MRADDAKNSKFGPNKPSGKDFALLRVLGRICGETTHLKKTLACCPLTPRHSVLLSLEYFKALNQWLAGYDVSAQATTTAAPSSTSSEVVRTNPVAQISALFAHWT